MSENAFNFNEFIKESKDSLVNPKAYFASMKTEGGLGEPIIKALLYGIVAVIIDVGTTRVPSALSKSGFVLKGDVLFDEVAPQMQLHYSRTGRRRPYDPDGIASEYPEGSKKRNINIPSGIKSFNSTFQ